MQDPLEALETALKKSIARYPEVKDDHRTIRKTFYVTPDENQQIDDLRQGINQSHFFRSRVLGKDIPRPKTRTPEIARQSYIHLRQIGRDINKIAAAFNQLDEGQKTEITESDRELLLQLKTLLTDMQKEIIQSQNGT